MKIPYPIEGLSEGRATVEQELRTSFSLQNTRPYDVSDERIRGGQRPGTALAYTTQVVGDFPVIKMLSVITTYITPEE
jgi:hypothetical protein